MRGPYYVRLLKDRKDSRRTGRVKGILRKSRDTLLLSLLLLLLSNIIFGKGFTRRMTMQRLCGRVTARHKEIAGECVYMIGRYLTRRKSYAPSGRIIIIYGRIHQNLLAVSSSSESKVAGYARFNASVAFFPPPPNNNNIIIVHITIIIVQ